MTDVKIHALPFFLMLGLAGYLGSQIGCVVGRIQASPKEIFYWSENALVTKSPDGRVNYFIKQVDNKYMDIFHAQKEQEKFRKSLETRTDVVEELR